MEAKKLEIRVPFAGFYCSLWDEAIDRAEEMEISNYCEDKEVDESKLGEAVYWCADYQAARLAIAAKYVARFAEYLENEHGLKIELSFVEMTSPREYNFETDRIFASISEADLLKLRAAVDAGKLAEIIHKRFTSRSGFISFYPADVADWPADILDWDYNQLETLFSALLADAPDFEYSIYERAMYEDVDNAVADCIDWGAVEKRLQEEACEVPV